MTVMQPVDLALLVGEIGSRTLHIGVLLIFGPSPDGSDSVAADAYRKALLAESAQSALMEMPVLSYSTGGLPVWRSAERIDMGRHLQRLALPHPGTKPNCSHWWPDCTRTASTGPGRCGRAT
ncbi:wax ester/triacylglycerol synthase family O-acyltransferase [Prescottella equi]|nr:wax ester/triacylglycerol synthase family O-acyltransferase [Prescottella equi]